MGRSRELADILGKTEVLNTNNEALLTDASAVDSAYVTANTTPALAFFNTLDSLPITSLTSGQQAYVSANNRLYISDGSGWYNKALITLSPTISMDPSGTITLASDGTTTSTVTVVAIDSDTPGSGLTYSVDSDGNGIGKYVISQDSSVFTIRPLSSDSGATEGTFALTFSATDGVNIATDSSSFSLTFQSVDGLSFGGNVETLFRNVSSSPQTTTVTVNTTGYSNGDTIPYAITGVTSSDISTALSGNITVGTPLTLTTATGNRTRANQTGTITVDGVSDTFVVHTKQSAASNNPFSSSSPWIAKRDSYVTSQDVTNSTGFIVGPVVAASYGSGIANRIAKWLRGQAGSNSTNQFYAGNTGISVYYGSFRAVKIYGVMNGTPTHTHTFTWDRTCGEIYSGGFQSTVRGAILRSNASTPNYCVRTFTHASLDQSYGIIDNFCYIEYYSNAAATSLINTSFWDGQGGYLV